MQVDICIIPCLRLRGNVRREEGDKSLKMLYVFYACVHIHACSYLCEEITVKGSNECSMC